MPDMSLLGFMRHLSGVTMAIEHEKAKALERAAVLVENEAKSEIGTYQNAAGPFPAWAELADSTKVDRAAQGYPENEPLLRTGELRDSIEHVVKGDEAVIGSNLDIAVYQELGTDRIPPRSFLGGAAMRRSHDVAKIFGAAAVKAVIGRDVPGGAVKIS